MKKVTLEYKGYVADLALDIEDKIIVGQVINTADLISFHGNTVEEAEVAFHDVLDSYLEACSKENIDPSRPYSGKFNLRIKPKTHQDLVRHAAQSNMSLNEYTEALIIRGISENKREYKR